MSCLYSFQHEFCILGEVFMFFRGLPRIFRGIGPRAVVTAPFIFATDFPVEFLSEMLKDGSASAHFLHAQEYLHFVYHGCSVIPPLIWNLCV